MTATSVTGVGPGDSHKRIAYLSSDLPKEKFTKTTSNDQDLITGEIEGGGCTCDFDTEWELIYSEAALDGNPPVDTGIVYDKLYTWAFGIRIISGGPPTMLASFIPITNSTLYRVIDLYIYGSFVGMEWSPNGGIDIFEFNFTSTEFSILRPSLFPAVDVVLLQNGGASIEIDAGTGTFITYFGEVSPGDTAYFVIARRRIVAL